MLKQQYKKNYKTYKQIFMFHMKFIFNKKYRLRNEYKIFTIKNNYI